VRQAFENRVRLDLGFTKSHICFESCENVEISVFTQALNQGTCASMNLESRLHTAQMRNLNCPA